MKTKTFTPIAMKCSQQEFDEIKEVLINHNIEIVNVWDFEHFPYLILDTDNVVTNIGVTYLETRPFKVLPSFDADLFLRCCGVEVEENRKIEIEQPEPWQPKYGDIVEAWNGKKWIDSIFCCINPDAGSHHKYIIIDDEKMVDAYGKIRQKTTEPNYSTHIEAIKAEAAKHGKTVTIEIKEI